MANISQIRRDSRGQQTRALLLEAAQQEIHRVGYQAASLDAILKNAGVTKGALYHHFPSKLELGYAVVDEWLGRRIEEKWIAPLQNSTDPLKQLARLLLDEREQGIEWLRLGCPLAGLALEMAALDDGFRERVNKIFQSWRGVISESLARGQVAGKVRQDISPGQTATFIVAALEGALMIGKSTGNIDTLTQCGLAMIQYLETLHEPGT